MLSEEQKKAQQGSFHITQENFLKLNDSNFYIEKHKCQV